MCIFSWFMKIYTKLINNKKIRTLWRMFWENFLQILTLTLQWRNSQSSTTNPWTLFWFKKWNVSISKLRTNYDSWVITHIICLITYDSYDSLWLLSIISYTLCLFCSFFFYFRVKNLGCIYFYLVFCALFEFHWWTWKRRSKVLWWWMRN